MWRGRRSWLALVAAGLNAVAWFMPVAEVPGPNPRDPPDIVTGWKAFKELLFPLKLASTISDGLLGALNLASPLTNLVFIVALVLLLRDGDRVARTSRRMEAALWICLALNCQWFFLVGIEYLHDGYYVWLGSFALLALAVRQRRGAELSGIPRRVM